MSHARITIDGDTVLDDNLDQWQRTPPEAIQQLVKPSVPQPWSTSILAVLAEAVLQHQPVTIDITVNGNGWTMNVSK